MWTSIVYAVPPWAGLFDKEAAGALSGRTVLWSRGKQMNNKLVCMQMLLRSAANQSANNNNTELLQLCS